MIIKSLEDARAEMRNAKTQIEYAQKKREFRKIRNQINRAKQLAGEITANKINGGK